MTSTLSFEVPGRPLAASNSKSISRSGHVYDRHKGKAAYVATVRLFAQRAAAESGWSPATGAVVLQVEYVFARPKGHQGTGRNSGKVKPTAPRHITTKPDLTNLTKTLEDALRGIAWQDDSQIVSHEISKTYGETEMSRVQVVEMGE